MINNLEADVDQKISIFLKNYANFFLIIFNFTNSLQYCHQQTMAPSWLHPDSLQRDDVEGEPCIFVRHEVACIAYLAKAT